jgi:hypothetical protein
MAGGDLVPLFIMAMTHSLSRGDRKARREMTSNMKHSAFSVLTAQDKMRGRIYETMY